MKNTEARDLCLRLLKADSTDEVVSILDGAGYWKDPKYWRLYGDKEGNFAQAGNQQALPEAALVEKIVNSCDARLMLECQKRGIGPESEHAPKSVRDAVAVFFENRHSESDEAGSLVNWPGAKRTAEARHITIAATGDRPTQGRQSKKMCLTIVDQAEGQTPLRMPKTILSLNAKNKQRIRFVQGKFNMGGSGALRFCGKGMQLVITRRHPDLAKKEETQDPTAHEWGFTVVRREEPRSESGAPIHSEFTYLAPIGAETNPRCGDVLRFAHEDLPLMPEHSDAYASPIKWGTAVKLYEYQTQVGQSNVIMPDGLLYAVERLLPEIALPIRMHECRAGYRGGKERSFETTLAGLVVRLEDGKGSNLEPDFPLSGRLQVGNMNMTIRTYAFKEDRAATYLRDEGVIFMVNGQAHGYLPKSIFSRPKSVGLQRLRDSLLLLVDCSNLTAMQREDLFMSSRDRLSKNPIRNELEHEIEELLHNSHELRRLQQERREQDVQSRLSDEKPLEEVLSKLLSSSPTLRALFLQGQRITRPFAGAGGENGDKEKGTKNGSHGFIGKRHPTFFRIPNTLPGETYKKNSEQGRRCRLKFETDVENGYFDRATDRGSFALEITNASKDLTSINYSITLNDGCAYLSLSVPADWDVGDQISFRASVNDPTLLTPFVSKFKVNVTAKQDRPSGPPQNIKKQHAGSGKESSTSGIQLPPVIMVHEGDEQWHRHKFIPNTACYVISEEAESGQTEHIFYVNADNVALKTEMKYSKQDPRLLEAKFKYGNVLLGLAILHDAEEADKSREAEAKGTDSEGDKETTSDTIRRISSAVAPVLIPMIDQLAGLREENMDEISGVGEDA